MESKILFSAIQPSGILTLGNYIGAISNWIKLLDTEYNCIFSIADLHTLTVKQDPVQFKQNVFDLAATYLACDLNPDKCIFFLQSSVHQHTELTWILNTITYPGELQRMTQFKDKSKSHSDNINMGLMDYPVLMASDILLYNTNLVPVGADQKQHLELARNLAERFNNRYTDTFIIPEPYISENGAKIMSLQNPDKKMSKSDANLNSFISLNDDENTIIKKFKKAVTDSENEVRYDAINKAGISNLLTIYSVMTGKTIKESENEFSGHGYGVFKTSVAEAVAEVLIPLQKRKTQFLSDKGYIENVLKNGAEKALDKAEKKIKQVYNTIGILYQK